MSDKSTPNLPSPPDGKSARSQPPAVRTPQARNMMQSFMGPSADGKQKGLTPASVVYALASGFFWLIAIFYLVTGPVLGGLLMILPAAILAGFAFRSLN